MSWFWLGALCGAGVVLVIQFFTTHISRGLALGFAEDRRKNGGQP